MSVHHPSPCENYPRPVSESAGKTHEGPQSFVQFWYRLQTLSEAPEDGNQLLWIQCLAESIQYAVYECAGVFPGKLFGEIDRFVQDDFRRRIGGTKFVHGEAQDRAIDGSEALESPVFRVLHNDFVQHGNFFCSAFEQAVSKLARCVSGFRAAPEFCFQLGGLLMAHVPLEEHLHGKLARFGAERHATCPASLGTQDLFLMCWFPRSRP